jgi:anthranilate/para-aminobenzoate synthase component I
MTIQPHITPRELPLGDEPSRWFVGAGLGTVAGALTVEDDWVIPATHDDPLGELERVLREERRSGSAWAIMLSYELGGHIEPRVVAHNDETAPFPAIVIQRLGEPLHAPAANALVESPGFSLGALRSSMGRAGYLHAVDRVCGYIAAGDIYQANIAHHLEASFTGSARACAGVLLSAAQPRYGAAMAFEHEGTHHTICSVSPELFLHADPRSGRIRTEPMKGTRPLGADTDELEQSPKDRAELNMITDLMRNDLGRVCKLGSVRVTVPRRIESHASSVLQASSEVQGTLRGGVGIAEMIRATFPPGSVTGAPKVRAMQIISELEGRPRNAYCGSMIHLDASGVLTASVSIRTAHIWGVSSPGRPGHLHAGCLAYPVGAGIVADSDPASEWAETLVKAAVLRSALGIELEPDGTVFSDS